MDNLRGLLVIRGMDKVHNAWLRQLCRVTKGVDKKIDEGVLRWFGHVEMMKDRIAKRVYVRECAGSCSERRLRKRWIDTVKDYLKKRGLDVRQARRMVHDSIWLGFVRGMHGALQGGLTIDLKKVPQPYEGRNLSVTYPTTSENKGENVFFHIF